MTEQSIIEVPINRIRGCSCTTEPDWLAVEEPLEIRLGTIAEGRRTHKSISITMRTPGDDFELAAGFLFTEGILDGREQIEQIRHCGPPVGAKSIRNVVRIDLRPGVKIDFQRLERHFYTSSSCGVCGKSSIEALQIGTSSSLPLHGPVVASEVIHQLANALRDSQDLFARTGGLHAAALFDASGTLQDLREDVGRHNAVDKLLGAQFLNQRAPLHDRLMLVSGRASFELVQKALVAGIPILAAVGAPSSLAVELASAYGMTLVGFVREHRFNIYTGAARIGGELSAARGKARSHEVANSGQCFTTPADAE